MAEHSFYAVGHGKKPGVYEKWADVQEQACFPALVTIQKHLAWPFLNTAFYTDFE